MRTRQAILPAPAEVRLEERTEKRAVPGAGASAPQRASVRLTLREREPAQGREGEQH